MKAAILACTLFRLRDPSTHKLGWVARCGAPGHQRYISMPFRESKKAAIRHAQLWLLAQPVNVRDLEDPGSGVFTPCPFEPEKKCELVK